MSIVTALEAGKRDKSRVNVYLDGAFAFSLNLEDAAKLHKGQTLSDTDIDGLRARDTLVRAVDSAIRFLATRPRSVHEVRDNLTRKQYEPQTIDLALEKLQALGYVDDQAFAAFWVKERTTFKPLGAQALRYELRQKGISDALIREVLSDLDVEDAAYRAAQSAAKRLRSSTRRDFRKKIGAHLQRRGFRFSDAETTIRRLIEEIDAEDPDFFGRGDDDGDE